MSEEIDLDETEVLDSHGRRITEADALRTAQATIRLLDERLRGLNAENLTLMAALKTTEAKLSQQVREHTDCFIANAQRARAAEDTLAAVRAAPGNSK